MPRATASPLAPKRTDRDLLEEVLQILRGMRLLETNRLSVNVSDARIRLRIDLSAIGSGEASFSRDAESTFQSLLDRIYHDHLIDRVPVYSYGTSWILEDAFGLAIEKEGSLDSRAIGSMKFMPEDVLRLRFLAEKKS